MKIIIPAVFAIALAAWVSRIGPLLTQRRREKQIQREAAHI